MVTQVNLKFQDSFYELAMEYVEKKGYMNIQELLRESLREKIFENSEIRTEYKKVLASQEANTFHNFEKSKKILDKMRKNSTLE
ncbi:hypothetical protein H6501_03960 [Candidatus Woesearchaeota archaeon]|nr:hypothetical protein [Candidatus Woesearchaeota archaeon]USN43803.1 MAG: hypothetical protein H6500_05435 [Candidatus Woesearchaeota archaeon]